MIYLKCFPIRNWAVQLCTCVQCSELQDLQVVALNIEVLGCVPAYAVPRHRPEGGGTALLRQPQAVAFALPLELVFLKVVRDVFAAKRKQLVNVQPPLGETLWEHGTELVPIDGFRSMVRPSIFSVIAASPPQTYDT